MLEVYYFCGLSFVLTVIIAVWLVRHPLVLLTVNVMPIAWFALGAPGVFVAALLLLPVAALFRRA
ncbi:MAG: hypothetical protein ACRD2C_06465 [Acidimicrobiales bacterium]